jgi:hypothetical protein
MRIGRCRVKQSFEVHEAEVFLASWHDAMSLASQWLEPVAGLYPPRWETKGYPSDEVLAQLRARSTPVDDPKEPTKTTQSKAKHVFYAPEPSLALTPPSSQAKWWIGASLAISVAIVTYALSR